jgi:GH24 family phage-related lysozyme (muramidase)
LTHPQHRETPPIFVFYLFFFEHLGIRMGYEIRTKVDTWFKVSAAQGSALGDNDKSFSKAQTTFPLAAYRLEADHLVVTLGKDDSGQQVFIKGRTNWYVYRSAVEILRDGQPISLSTGGLSSASGGVTDSTKFEVSMKVDTWLKAQAVQGSQLADNDKVFTKAQKTYPISGYKPEGDHLLLTLGKDASGQQVFVNGRTNWYVYRGAVDLLRDGKPISMSSRGVGGTPTAGGAPSGGVPMCGVELIKQFEGYAEELPDGRARAYADPIYGWEVPTIGYGTTKYPNGQDVRQGDVITRDQAEEYLIHHIDSTARPDLEKIPTWGKMNDNQRGAIYSFAYNLGSGFYGDPDFGSITRVCDSVDRWKDLAWITEQFVKYRNPGTPAEAGLRRRREAEAKLFVS